ncbi:MULTISPECIES: VOC family protein [Pseudomonas]|uniref:Dioxygenase protein n=3 Tax=Pseudomonas TaxID=286 RepID=A0A1L7NBA3_PSEPU|nr:MULTISPECIES: VOC family protein [Pseudomonas]MBP2083948.1 catechol 2,3-dioxygenase-like lactoylglutathione lyase family enzyme [Pseudomonas sp. PvP089]MBP2090350.1 catechol 2,3-dioxygenase-like lactoylglutathione lyase family enzyme [Pseudomonas sp. PvP088]MBP2223486.1 catechol 2,3-dioxygenase-like lactoylglutathione lyase family enzyme [Pseudomonas putida]MDO1498228.1 VOC family protein [Pseudomonas putida]BAW22736.1 dioxygenase protein [Pseudomonas putida]
MRPFTIKHIDHLVLRVSDLPRSVAFYTGLLGCHVSRVREDLGMVHLGTGTAMIDLVTLDGPLGRPGGAAPGVEGRNLHHFCLRIEPFDEAALTAYLEAAGVKVEPAEKRYGAEGEGPSLYCYDPDGNQVELKGPVAEAI